MSVGAFRGRGYGEYLSKEDWENIKSTSDLNAGPHLATIILGRANELLDAGHLRQAFVEAGSAAELAVNKYLLSKGEALGVSGASIAQFFDLPLSKQIAITVTIARLSPKEVLSEALRAIDIRNKIVHEGKQPSDKDAGCLVSLMQVVATLLETEHKFPVLTSSNRLDALVTSLL